MSQTFTQLSPHLWVQQSQLYYTNSGLFISQQQACLIDPCIFPDEIKSMVDFVAEQKIKPQILALTHSHWDHILGPEHFPTVKTVAQANYLNIIQAEGQTILKQITAWEKEYGLTRETPFIIPKPDIVFDETLSLQIGDLSLELMPVPGHAPDQLALYHPDSGTLWASDILSDIEIPFISDSLVAFEKTLAHLATLDIQVLVPGHGHATTDPANIQTRLAEDSAYLSALRERIEPALQAGRSVSETVALCDDIAYRVPAENEGSHRLNIESVYLELGGEGDPKKMGWGQDWAD